MPIVVAMVPSFPVPPVVVIAVVMPVAMAMPVVVPVAVTVEAARCTDHGDGYGGADQYLGGPIAPVVGMGA